MSEGQAAYVRTPPERNEPLLGKIPGEIISVELPEKNGDLGVALCNAGPLCTCSVVWCSAWKRCSNHREDDRQRLRGDKGRQAECQAAFAGFRGSRLVWRCFWSGGALVVTLWGSPSAAVNTAPQRTA